MTKKMTANDIELRVASHFDYRRNIIVPNLSWMFGYELDLLIVRRSGHGVEVEIKVTRSDLKKDLEKVRRHDDPRIRELYFAVPQKLTQAAIELAPADAGIFALDWWQPPEGGEAHEYPPYMTTITQIRPPVVRRHARAFNSREIAEITRLGAMRIWPLKGRLREVRHELVTAKKEAP